MNRLQDTYARLTVQIPPATFLYHESKTMGRVITLQTPQKTSNLALADGGYGFFKQGFVQSSSLSNQTSNFSNHLHEVLDILHNLCSKNVAKKALLKNPFFQVMLHQAIKINPHIVKNQLESANNLYEGLSSIVGELQYQSNQIQKYAPIFAKEEPNCDIGDIVHSYTHLLESANKINLANGMFIQTLSSFYSELL